MTESEAIKELKEDIALYDNETTRLDASIGTPDRNLIDALEMSIQALEKQMPKKTVRMSRSRMGNDYRDYYCSCGMFIGYEPRVLNYLESGTQPFSYCCNCGQKLDWSDDNDD